MILKITIQSTPKGFQANVWQSDEGKVQQRMLPLCASKKDAILAATKEALKEDPDVRWS